MLYSSYITMLYSSYITMLYSSYITMIYSSYITMLYSSYITMLYSSYITMLYSNYITMLYIVTRGQKRMVYHESVAEDLRKMRQHMSGPQTGSALIPSLQPPCYENKGITSPYVALMFSSTILTNFHNISIIN